MAAKRQKKPVRRLKLGKGVTRQKLKRVVEGLARPGRKVRAVSEQGKVAVELSNPATGLLRFEVQPDGNIKLNVRDTRGR